jgi:hypothetical protein
MIINLQFYWIFGLIHYTYFTFKKNSSLCTCADKNMPSLPLIYTPMLDTIIYRILLFYFWCLMPLSAIFQLYHDNQF